MLFDLFYERDVSASYEEWITISEAINVDGDPRAIDIWDVIQSCEKPPHIGNACMAYTLSAICSWCEEKGYPADYYVNGSDSHLYIDSEEIRTVSEFWQKIAELDDLAQVS